MREKDLLQTLFLLQGGFHPKARRIQKQEFSEAGGGLHVQFIDPRIPLLNFR